MLKFAKGENSDIVLGLETLNPIMYLAKAKTDFKFLDLAVSTVRVKNKRCNYWI